MGIGRTQCGGNSNNCVIKIISGGLAIGSKEAVFRRFRLRTGSVRASDKKAVNERDERMGKATPKPPTFSRIENAMAIAAEWISQFGLELCCESEYRKTQYIVRDSASGQMMGSWILYSGEFEIHGQYGCVVASGKTSSPRLFIDSILEFHRL